VRQRLGRAGGREEDSGERRFGERAHRRRDREQLERGARLTLGGRRVAAASAIIAT
jgi:hypothetical protein